jgi:hypothetical protein
VYYSDVSQPISTSGVHPKIFRGRGVKPPTPKYFLSQTFPITGRVGSKNIPTRKTENDVSWRGPKVGIPQIPLIPGGPPEDLEKNFCGAALDPDQDYQVASKKSSNKT